MHLDLHHFSSFSQIRLNRLSKETGSNIYAKAEFMNPGGSVKDRAALYVVKDAEEKGTHPIHTHTHTHTRFSMLKWTENRLPCSLFGVNMDNGDPLKREIFTCI